VLRGGTAGAWFLADQLTCARALLDAYEVTGNRIYLGRVERLVNISDSLFAGAAAGRHAFALQLDAVARKQERVGRLATSLRPFGLNCALATILMRLQYHTANAEYSQRTARLMEYLFSVPLVTNDLRFCHLADAWLWHARRPARFVMVGSRGDPYSELVRARLDVYCPRSVLVHAEAIDGEVRLGDLAFPETDRPQLFVCMGADCSSPIENPETAAAEISAFLESSR
jgi:uncharacterized protein YyaL (SSP411 family)